MRTNGSHSARCPSSGKRESLNRASTDRRPPPCPAFRAFSTSPAACARAKTSKKDEPRRGKPERGKPQPKRPAPVKSVLNERVPTRDDHGLYGFFRRSVEEDAQGDDRFLMFDPVDNPPQLAKYIGGACSGMYLWGRRAYEDGQVGAGVRRSCA